MSKEITAKQYASKIVEVAYHEVLPNKENIFFIVEALIKEYSDQNTKPLIDEIAELKNQVSNCNRMIGHLEEISINKQTEIAELRKALNQIQDYQMDFVELARTTTVYKIAESALNKLKASKQEANEAVEFAEWLSANCEITILENKWIYFSGIEGGETKLTTELYEIFKTRNNK